MHLLTAPTHCGSMNPTFQLGDRVLVDGRIYIVRGFSPMSVQPPRLVLQDASTRDQREVPTARATRT